MEVWIPVVAALLGLTGSIIVLTLEQRERRREDLRQRFSAALADMYAWAEFPYRIRRRSSAPGASALLAARMSDLQERLRYNASWLALESEAVANAYQQLWSETRTLTAPAMRDAWESPAPTADRDLNLGGTLQIDIQPLANVYLAVVREHLSRRWR